MIAESNAEFSSWEKVLSGQVGFILATVLFGLFFWRVLLPRWDKQCESLRKLTAAVSIIAVKLMRDDGKAPVEIMDEVNRLSSEDTDK